MFESKHARWQQTCIDRLIASVGVDGGWGYQFGHESMAEPTALSCLAIATVAPNVEAIQNGLEWLARAQRKDGAVVIQPGLSGPCWPTSLAVLSWLRCAANESAAFADHARHAAEWLLQEAGSTFRSNSGVYGHSTQLEGWPWVDGTHSWVEPTAYSVLALRAAGLSDHPRVREAVRLLSDRAIPKGGWNYGNSRMFGNTLRPFPAQTGIALAALAGEPMTESIDAGLAFLSIELERIRTPMSFSWGVIGMTAWGKRSNAVTSGLEECALRLEKTSPRPALDSLLLLADAKDCPLVSNAEVSRYGKT